MHEEMCEQAPQLELAVWVEDEHASRDRGLNCARVAVARDHVVAEDGDLSKRDE